jgi:hypothetical protein
MKQIILRQLSLIAFLCVFNISTLKAQDEIIGRWDLNVSNGERSMPSWLEVKQSGNKALVGYYVSYAGSARPIAEVMWKDGLFSFSIPPQWIGTHYMQLTGTVNADRMEGNILDHMGNALSFTGERAPVLLREPPSSWSKPRPLLDKNSLSGWIPVSENATNQWFVKDGVLTSPASGVNLRTEETFEDFKLHIEFRYPEHSNSGVYLRGRYEVQVEDSYGKQPSSVYLGGVYGFLTPNENVAKKAGEWQSYDITLVGRRVTVVANGKTIIGNQIIPGITGGALDSNEAAPGPIYLQGDHGPIEYRNITISVPE